MKHSSFEADYGRYTIHMTVLTILILILTLAFMAKTLFIDSIFPFQNLFQYQLAKINAASEISTIWVGDSSLGNAIDSEYFNALTGSRTLNLALTGYFGYAGSYNMMKKALKIHPIKNVIIMQSQDMMERDVSYRGYLYTFESPHLLTVYDWMMLVKEFMVNTLSMENLLNVLKSYFRLSSMDPKIYNDYVEQASAIDPVVCSPGSHIVNPQKIYFLKKMVDLARDNHVNIYYIHGPLLEDCRDNNVKFYLEQADLLIRSTGIPIVGNPVWIESEDIGDSVDHVRPDRKQKYTQIFVDLLMPFLKER